MTREKMKNKEILKKAIKKAWPDEVIDIPSLYEGSEYYRLIFNHAFAKAFFGRANSGVFSPYGDNVKTEEEYKRLGTYPIFTGEAWKFHLQRMVLEKNPLKYLEKFLRQPKILNNR